jgi:SAM-dependent methyltransferase
MHEPTDPEQVREAVREGYGKVAVERSGSGTSASQSCCGAGVGRATPASSPAEYAARLGYAPEDLAALPEGANMGLSCGNPAAIAALRPGQVVLDLGSGGGFDCFLAGPRVGPKGRVIGVDMTPEMVSVARRNLAGYRQRSGLDNVEFRLGEIEHLPVADRSVDVVLSNCVINLSPDKPQVWRDVARVLRPGGRVAVSDVALLRPLPPAITGMVQALIGCVAGAVLLDEYRAMVQAAEFADVTLEQKPEFVEAVMGGGDPVYAEILAALPPGTRVADYVTSVTVTAVLPGTAPTPAATRGRSPA